MRYGYRLRLNKGKLVLYSLVRFGSTTVLTFTALTSYYFYGEFLKVNPVVNGVSHFMSRLMMAVMGFVFGYYSDRLMLTNGNARKLFILLGSASLSLSFYMLYHPITESLAGNELLISLYLFFWAGLLGASYSALIVPYQAWMPELTVESQRPLVSFLQNVFNMMGDGLGAVLAFLLMDTFTMNKTLFYSVISYIAIGQIILYVLLLLLVHGGPGKVEDSIDIARDARLVLNDESFITWESSRAITSASSIMFTAMVVYLIIDFFKLIEPSNMPLLIGVALVIIIFSASVLQISKKYSILKIIFYNSIIFSMGLLSIFLVSNIDFLVNASIGTIVLTVVGIGLAGYWLFVYAVLANIIEESTKRYKKILAGTYTGLDNINTSIAEALGYLALGITQQYLSIANNTWAFIAGLIAIFNIVPLSKLVNSTLKNKFSRNGSIR